MYRMNGKNYHVESPGICVVTGHVDVETSLDYFFTLSFIFCLKIIISYNYRAQRIKQALFYFCPIELTC